MSKDWTGNSKASLATVAPSNRTEKERAQCDFYATEPKATELLTGLETFAKRIWEPACGEGHISRVLRAHGYEVRESDIVDRCGNEVKDFLAWQPEPWDGDIVTNPPYSMAGEFVERALECVSEGAKVAFFLKLTFLESEKRKNLFSRTPPVRVWVSRNRLACWPNGKPCDNKLIAYAWFIWKKGFKGDPAIRWFN